MRTVAATVAVIISFSVFGCKSESAKTGENAAPKGEVIAEVNGTPITSDQFNKELKGLPPQLQGLAQSVEGKKQLLDTMITQQIILQQAKKDGLDKSKEVADQLADLKDKVVVQAYLKKKLENIATISDADLQKMYEQNKERFRTGDQIKASHILVKTDKEAQDVEDQLKKGASFEDLAKKYSIDSSASRGGDLGWFSKGSMVPDFEKAAFGLKEGQVSAPVKTQFGYHIIKVTGKRPAGILPFSEVKDQLKAAALPEKQQEAFKKLKDDLRKDAKVTIKEDALKNIPAPSDKGAAGMPASK